MYVVLLNYGPCCSSDGLTHEEIYIRRPNIQGSQEMAPGREEKAQEGVSPFPHPDTKHEHTDY